MAENKLPPADEARVRTAAQVAADRMGWNVPRQILDYIIATSDPKQSPAALEMRAAGIVEYAKNHPAAPMLRDNEDKTVHGFLQVIHGQVMSHFGGLAWRLAEAREANTSASGTSKYTELYSGSDWSSDAGKRFVRDYAQKQRMAWVPDELLRLGPGTIDTLKQAHFRKESFQNLKDAGYQGREAAEMAVGISHYAIKHNLDSHHITQETKGAVKDFGQGDQQQEREWRDRIKKFVLDPEDSEKRHELDSKLEHFERHGTFKQRERAKSFRDAVKLERQATLEANAETANAEKREVRADRHEANLADKKEANDDLLAELNSPAPTSTASSSSAPPSENADKQKTAEKPATPIQPVKVASASAAPKPS